MIYLDIDGVMLAGNDYGTSPWRIPQIRITMLRRLLDHTGSSLVLSSTWRRSMEGKRVLVDAGLWDLMARHLPNGNRVDWHTPLHIDPLYLDETLSVRGQEIQAHIDCHGIERYVILDDDCVLVGQNHVPIMTNKGLTDSAVDDAINIWDQQGEK